MAGMENLSLIDHRDRQSFTLNFNASNTYVMVDSRRAYHRCVSKIEHRDRFFTLDAALVTVASNSDSP